VPTTPLQPTPNSTHARAEKELLPARLNCELDTAVCIGIKTTCLDPGPEKFTGGVTCI
jgi:hypothetical protein